MLKVRWLAAILPDKGAITVRSSAGGELEYSKQVSPIDKEIKQIDAILPQSVVTNIHGCGILLQGAGRLPVLEWWGGPREINLIVDIARSR